MSTDTLSNILSMIKNGALAKKPFIETMYTKQAEAVAKVLEAKGFLKNVKVFKEKDSSHKKIHLDIEYQENGLPKITEVKRISKPGRRIYLSSKDLKVSKSGYGTFVVSTSRGVMDSKDAKYKKLGGEVLCEVF